MDTGSFFNSWIALDERPISLVSPFLVSLKTAVLLLKLISSALSLSISPLLNPQITYIYYFDPKTNMTLFSTLGGEIKMTEPRRSLLKTPTRVEKTANGFPQVN